MATVTKKKSKVKFRGSTKFFTFADLESAGVFDKPANQRPEYAIGHGKVVPRDFGIRGAELEALKVAHAAGDIFPNPHHKGFSYFLIEALKSLGLDRNHSMKRVIERFRELASENKDRKTGKTFWQTFKNKESRNEATGRSWLGRFEQNIEVLQRVPIEGRKNVTPYGLKLLRVGQMVLGTKGAVIDVVYGSTGDVMVRLNTNSAIPVNETKKAKTAAQKAIEAAVSPAVESPVEPAAETVAETVTAVETVDAGGGIMVDIVTPVAETDLPLEIPAESVMLG